MDNCVAWGRNAQGAVQCTKLAAPKK